MDGNFDRDSVRCLAEMLEKKFPQTDLLSVNDNQLKEMILSLNADVSQDKKFFFAVKSAWAFVREDEKSSDSVQEAYI